MTADGRSNGHPATTVPFWRTIRPLLIAPAGALAVIGWFAVTQQNAGPYLAIVVLLTAPFVYAAEALFVLPLVLFWPALRRPNVAVGVVWGAAAAWAFVLALQTLGWLPPRYVALPSTWREWQDVVGLWLPGGASGLLFAYLSRKNEL